MTSKEAITTLELAISEIEWNYPLDISVALETAMEALKKQIPKKPKGVTDPMFGDIELRCHRCDNANLANPFRCNGYAYCPDCGQALDWGETDD